MFNKTSLCSRMRFVWLGYTKDNYNVVVKVMIIYESKKFA